MKTGFFRALAGSCAGTAIFEKLRFQHWGRAIWHLLLMTFISTFIMFWGIYPDLRQAVVRSVEIAGENCGTLRFSADGIAPSEMPEKSRMFLVAGPLSVTYTAPDAAALPENFTQGAEQGIIWNGSQIIIWVLNGNTYLYGSIEGSITQTGLQSASSESDLLAALKKSKKLEFSMPEGEYQDFTPGQLKAVVQLMLPVGLGIVIFQQTLLEIVIYMIMFSLVFLVMNFNRPGRLKFMEMITLAVYAGFPAMIIGSAATALQLPVLSFNIVYVLGMTFYMIVIMNRLEKNRQEREWQSRDV